MENKEKNTEKRDMRITVNLTNTEYLKISTVFLELVHKHGIHAPKWSTFIHCALIYGVQFFAEEQ